MYALVLILHSLIRWVTLLLAVAALVRALGGWFGARPWTALDEKLGVWTVMTVDIQFVLGLALYLFLSPITAEAMSNFGAAMKIPQLRFWAVEHVTPMIVALALLHVGRVRVKKSSDPIAKHRTTAIFFLLGLIAILAGIPWPGMANGRPLLRLSV